jgi:hypothetical protein
MLDTVHPVDKTTLSNKNTNKMKSKWLLDNVPHWPLSGQREESARMMQQEM